MRSKGDRFPLGSIYVARGAHAALAVEEVIEALCRHAAGDWGDCCTVDVAENEFAVDKYLRLFSVYHTAAGRQFWVITDAYQVTRLVRGLRRRGGG